MYICINFYLIRCTELIVTNFGIQNFPSAPYKKTQTIIQVSIIYSHNCYGTSKLCISMMITLLLKNNFIIFISG